METTQVDFIPGVYWNMPHEQYRAIKAYSYSDVKRMLPTPKDYKWLKDHPKPPSIEMYEGTIINRMVLEPEIKELEGFAIKPEPRAPNGWKESMDKSGTPWMTVAGYEDCKQAAAAIRDDEYAGSILLGEGSSEVSILFEFDGAPCKARIDRVPSGVDYLADLKKTRDNTPGRYEDGRNEQVYWKPSPFTFQVKDSCYHMQAGVYLHAWNLMVPTDPRDRWLNVTVEAEPPYHVRVFEIKKESIAKGLDLFRRLLKQLRECEESGVWPGYKQEVEVIEV